MSYAKVYDKIKNGRKSSIGTTAVQLSAEAFNPRCGVTIKADIANTGTVFVGNSDVTNASKGDVDCGFRLQPGESLTLEAVTLQTIYVIGSAAGQTVYWIAV